MKRTVSNIFYNSLYQVLILFVPLLTIPYVSRVLGTDGVGVNALVTSVANFFGTIIVIGLYQLGAREIAKASRQKLRATFWALWKLQLYSGVIVILLYVISTLVFVDKNKLYYVLEVPFLISYALDISWFFVGIGEIKKVILRNTFIKVLSLGLIFVLVKNPSDLWIYVLILSGSNLLANLIFLTNLKHALPDTVHSDLNRLSQRYLKSALALLLPQIALQLYTNLDDVLVGGIAGASQLAYYDQSQRIARIVVTILTSASTVVMPKLAAIKNEKQFNRIFELSLDITLVAALFLCCLMMVNSQSFVLWYYGAGFRSMVNNMFYISPIIVLISYGGVFSNQYMLAKGEFTKFSVPYYFGGVLNIILNVILVRRYGANGGTVSLLITESVICLSRLVLVKNELQLRSVLKGQYKYLLVFVGTLLLKIIFPVEIEGEYFISLILQSVVTTIVFVFGLFLLKTNVAIQFKRLWLDFIKSRG
ncbi:polysaccharide biosynthesis family protein [Lactiplantibacillus xiangfangensis]|uniref:Polysaccharide biosynthesis family protein n=2 Tax=Lactiplantibacillus xiangfangensis TaxID=942150 RepID=A0A0R2M9P8_9LACO|nr:oligosaccharide flippase family protein [Lactiplantibacillus xiangfangensis]KRO08747.1 polysaccharide biosynthesis family protein [Lactiplantibacillus xiangfangensis]